MFGKSVFSTVFSKFIEKQNKSILIIDACKQDCSINLIFGKTVKEKFQKISNNISYMCYEDIDMLNNYLNFVNTIENLKKQFDCILIDTSFDDYSNIYKNLTSISNDIIFLIEPNLIEVQKAKRILEVYQYDFEVPNEKIKIIFNKVNEFQISDSILKEIFDEYKILEYIRYQPEYSLYINKNTRYEIKDDTYEMIYKKLFE